MWSQIISLTIRQSFSWKLFLEESCSVILMIHWILSKVPLTTVKTKLPIKIQVILDCRASNSQGLETWGGGTDTGQSLHLLLKIPQRRLTLILSILLWPYPHPRGRRDFDRRGRGKAETAEMLGAQRECAVLLYTVYHYTPADWRGRGTKVSTGEMPSVPPPYWRLPFPTSTVSRRPKTVPKVFETKLTIVPWY